MKDFRDDVAQKLEEGAKSLKEKIGDQPRGAARAAARVHRRGGPLRDDPKLPIAVAIMADAGENEEKMAEVLTKATKQAEDAGAKISQETFNGLTIHVLRRPPDDKAKEKAQEKDAKKSPDIPLVWTQSENLFYFIGTPERSTSSRT